MGTNWWRVFWGGSAWDSALCTGSLLAVGVIRYVIQVQRASRRLRSLPGYVRERLDQDLQTGDRINDLYFTSDFLLVYRLQFRRKQGFACIPYPEIGGVSIGQNGRAKKQLDILSPEGNVLHTVTCSLEVSQAQAEEIGRKILFLKSRMQMVRDAAGEQSRRDRAAQAGAEKDSERPSRLLLQPRCGPGLPGLYRYGGAFPGEGGAAGGAPIPGRTPMARFCFGPIFCSTW